VAVAAAAAASGLTAAAPPSEAPAAGAPPSLGGFFFLILMGRVLRAAWRFLEICGGVWLGLGLGLFDAIFALEFYPATPPVPF